MSGQQETADAFSSYLSLAQNELESSRARIAADSQPGIANGSVPEIDSLIGRVAGVLTDVLSEAHPSADRHSVSDVIASSIGAPPARDDFEWTPDYGLPTFELAKLVGQKNPVACASELGLLACETDFFESANNFGPFMNVRVRGEVLSTHVNNILDSPDATKLPHKGKLVLIDYSAPNIAKPFGVNHLRSTVIGEALARIKTRAGYDVVRDNHLGDWGTQFGNLLAAYERFGSDKPFEKLSTDELNQMYVRFSREKNDNPELVFEGRKFFQRLHAKEPGLVKAWMSAVSRSREEFDEVYQRMGIEFDTQIGEAYFESRATALLNEIEDNPNKTEASKIVFGDDGTAYIDGEHPVMLRTQDGYAVYAARDLATVAVRTEIFNPDEVLYVVGEEQATSFDAMFNAAHALDLTGNPPTKLEHVAFGLLLDDSRKKLSTRKGTSGKLVELLDEMDDRAYQNLKQRNPDLEEAVLRADAATIGLGALVWNDLRADKKKSVVFDPANMLAIGYGGVIDAYYPYLRSKRILEKIDLPQEVHHSGIFSNQIEHALATRLADFNDIIQKSSDANSPHVLVNYLHQLSKLHGTFYEESPVARESDVETRTNRIALHIAFMKVMSTGLDCLNIKIPSVL